MATLAWWLIEACLAGAIVFAGEAVFAGPALAWQWMHDAPAAFACGTVIAWLLLRTARVAVSRTVAVGMVALLVGLLDLAGRIKMAKLGAPLVPADLLLVDQLAPVARMFWGRWVPVCVAVALAVAGLVAWHAWRRRRPALQPLPWPAHMALFGPGALLAVLLLVPDFTGGDRSDVAQFLPRQLSRIGVDNYRFAPLVNVQKNGQWLAFLFEMRGVVIDRTTALFPPSGYSPERVHALFGPARQIGVAAKHDAVQATDVVVIMSEAWWDPARLPGLRFDDPLLDKLHATARGTLYSPTFGGYTANVEFEFLTRLSTAFLTPGSVPYQAYVNRPLPSVPADFAGLGYETIAIHPYDGTFWNRNVVYPRLGFDRFLTQDDFVAPDRVEPYISDHALALKIIETLDATPAKRKFVFAVSMQNHAPYVGTGTRYKQRVAVDDPRRVLDDEIRDTLSTYATGVRDAVASFNEVVAYFQRTGRPAVVVMFGDHLPYLGDRYGPYFRTGFVSADDEKAWTPEDYLQMHGVPVVGWSNLPQGLDLPQQARSPIFLSAALKRAAGVPRSAAAPVLTRLLADEPVLTHEGERGRDLQRRLSEPAIADYRMLVYDQLSGNGYATCVLRAALCSVDAQKKKGRATSK